MYTCKYCGQPSWIDPGDQEAPVDYCHPSDHGEMPEEIQMEIFAENSLHKSSIKAVRRISDFWAHGLNFRDDGDFLKGLNLDAVRIILREMEWEFEEHCRRNA